MALLWGAVWANLAAIRVQGLSAKLGIASGLRRRPHRSLPLPHPGARRRRSGGVLALSPLASGLSSGVVGTMAG